MSKENCSEHLRQKGESYPRTCKECGLGRCKYVKRELKDLTKEEYTTLNSTGFLFEFYFEATGNWWNDCGQYQEAANGSGNFWRPIDSAPRNRYILLAGNSGYITAPLRVEVGKWSQERDSWMNHGSDYFTDGGPAPIYWAELPKIPAK